PVYHGVTALLLACGRYTPKCSPNHRPFNQPCDRRSSGQRTWVHFVVDGERPLSVPVASSVTCSGPPHRLQLCPQALRWPNHVQRLYALFASERLSPSARERAPSRLPPWIVPIDPDRPCPGADIEAVEPRQGVTLCERKGPKRQRLPSGEGFP